MTIGTEHEILLLKFGTNVGCLPLNTDMLPASTGLLDLKAPSLFMTIYSL